MHATGTKHDLNSQSHRVTHRVKLLGRLAGTALRDERVLELRGLLAQRGSLGLERDGLGAG